MIQVGIVGGAGYTAGELLRLLVNHSKVSIRFVYSSSSAGKPIYTVHRDLLPYPELVFTDTVEPSVDVVFLCLGHGNSREFLSKHHFSGKTKIIDLSNDFRLHETKTFLGKTFVYGLPELNLEHIKTAHYIANPGCFATAIQLSLLPLAKAGLLAGDIHANATTGSTGAGSSLSESTHFSWRYSNMSQYKPFAHQHLGEIGESICGLQEGFRHSILFIPNRGNFSRGIFATVYTTYTGLLDNVVSLYKSFYKDATFTFVSPDTVDLKQVINTNNCFISLELKNNTLLITTVIDNLLKGASGQAVHNMNLMFGIDPQEGLRLKAIFY